MADAGLEITDGRVYVVRRTRDGGQTYEMTVKRAFVFRDRIELRPESTNPAHTAITVKRGKDEDFDGTHGGSDRAGLRHLRVAGVVTGLSTSCPRSSRASTPSFLVK